jgi:hypothetical protein
MTTFRRVPYEPDPNAAPYHAAHAYTLTKSANDPAKFAWWYVDNCIGQMTLPDAWTSAPDDVNGTT